MKQLQFLVLFLLLSSLTFGQTSLENFLKAQPQIKSVEKIEGNNFFKRTYKIMVEQAVDHQHPEKGTFLQRVFVAEKAVEAPVVFITEGYTADYAASPGYINELSPLLGANQICVEHRYFGESWPNPVNWDYLTVRNAAADQHTILQILKKYYNGKWISTGISKGGQTVVYHRWLYPNDVDASVPYVAPLNFSVEEKRHSFFIANTTGTPEKREKVKNFQFHILKNRAVFKPMLESFCKEKHYTFRTGMDELLDYIVLEYPFAMWQYGISTDKMPALSDSPQKQFDYLVKVSSPSYMAIEGMENIKSFFVQAARELGYYGYNTKPFKDYLSIKTTKGYIHRIFIPKGLNIKYHKKTAREVKKFIQTTDAKILFIYGGWDPWFASSFAVPDKDNFLKIVKTQGSHGSRILNLPEEQKQQVKAKLEEWLGCPVNID